MTTLRITSKGQVTLKKDVLRHMGVGPGDRVQVELLPTGKVNLAPAARTGSIEDLFGMFYDPARPPVSIEEMNQVIADGWAGRL